MTEKLTLQQIKPLLFGAFEMMRGEVQSSDYKTVIFIIFFLKRISDEFDEEKERLVNHYLSLGKSQSDAERLACDESNYNKSLFVPECSRWLKLLDLKYDIASKLNKAIKEIEKHNHSLEGVFSVLEIQKLTDKNIRHLLLYFSKYRFRNQDFESPDLIGTTFEHFIQEAAEFEGKLGGEYATPIELSRLMVSLLKPTSDMTIYDPTSGMGGILTQARKYLLEKGYKINKNSFYGQELNDSSWAMSKINMVMHGVLDADIRNGDTLINPQHISNGKLMSFDRVIASPPFSLQYWKEQVDNDPYGRYPYGTPPKTSADFAFIQHMIASLNSQGKMAVVVNQGVLFRSSASEKNIRKGIIEDDLIEAIIELPSSLFFSTSIPSIIIIINKNKGRERKNKILFIGAEEEYENTLFRNKLRESDIEKIVSIYENLKKDDILSEYITLDQIKNNDFNFSSIIKEIKWIHKISLIDGNFKKFKLYNLSDISKDIKKLKPILEGNNSDNDIFIPSVGKSEVVATREETKLKDHNLFRVSLNDTIVRSKYLTIFFKSKVGRLCIESRLSQGTIAHLNLSSIGLIKVYVPSLLEQDKIISACDKLALIKTRIDNIEKKVRLNPFEKNIEKILDNILSPINNLNSEVSPLLCEESITHEFKASLRKPLPDYPELSVDEKGQKRYQIRKESFKSKKEIHTYFEDIVLKTVASFMNTRGGTLVIGIHEYGNKKEVVGIDREEFDSMDHYNRHLVQLLNNAFNKVKVSMYIDITIEELKGKQVCVVKCKKSEDDIIYLKDNVFVRTGPRVDKLSTEEVVELYKEKSVK